MLDNVFFIVFSGSHGTAWNLDLSESSAEIVQPLIILDFAVMRNEGKTKDSMMDMVAHEIGHYISGHMRVSNDFDCERKADDPAEKWGLKRYYDNYDKFEKMKNQK